MSDNSDSLFREVDEEVRRDQMVALWKRYGGYLIAALGLALIAAGGWQLWRNHVEEERRHASALYAQAVETAGEAEPQLAADAFAASLGQLAAGYRTLAQFQQAAALVKAGDKTAAVAIYDGLAREAEDPRMQSLARYLAAAALAGDADRDAVIARLQPLATPGNAFYYSALELLGALAYGAGDYETARTHLSGIAESAAAPASLRARARELLQLVEAAQPASPAGQPEAAAAQGDQAQ